MIATRCLALLVALSAALAAGAALVTGAPLVEVVARRQQAGEDGRGRPVVVLGAAEGWSHARAITELQGRHQISAGASR